MDVRGVGAGPAGVELSGALRGLPGLKGPAAVDFANLTPSGDTISSILRELSAPQVERFLAILELPPPPEMAAHLDVLMGAAISAAVQGNAPQALVRLMEFAALDPRRAETLETVPGLAPIRTEVVRLLVQLASTAQVDAELRLGQAAHLVHAAGSLELPGLEIKPEVAILIAGRFLEAGGYANNMRSTEVSQMLISQYGWAATVMPLPVADPRRIPIRSTNPSRALPNKWIPRIKKLWQRAPLLVLLLGWLTGGFLAGSVAAILRGYWPQMMSGSLVAAGFEVWALGFLALIAFGFYARVRNIRR
jgi:hypothetical protein